jgi:hypothetical protein
MQMCKYMFGLFWLVSIVFNVTNVFVITGREIPACLSNIDFITALTLQLANAAKAKFINIILFASSLTFYGVVHIEDYIEVLLKIRVFGSK